MRGHAPLRIGGLFADPLHGLRPCAGGYGAHLRGRRAAGCGGVPAADQYAGPAGLAGAQRTEPLGARRSRAGGLRRKRDLLALQTFGHLHHPIHPQAGRAVVRDAAAHDRRRQRLSQRGDRTRTDRRGIYRLHSSRTGRSGQGTCCGRRGADAARLRIAPGNLFPAQGRLDSRSPVHGADGVELPLGTRSGYAGRGRRDEDRNSAERPVPHLRADEELDGPLGRQGEACPRRLPPPHRRPRLRHALRYGRSRMALAGGRYDLPYGGRPPSRAARSGGIRRALRRHPLHAARRGARRFARNGLPAAQQPARPARRTRRAGDVRFRRRGRRRGRHVRRHCGGTAGVARGADPGPQGVGRQQLVGGARRAGRPAQYRRLPVAGLSAQ